MNPMNDIKNYVPPGFNDRALAANTQQVYKLNIPLMYSNKNPSWQQLTINEADVLDPEVIMPRMSQEQLFAPETEDVRMLEHEVNLYRTRMRDEELEEMQVERLELQRMLKDGDHPEDLQAKMGDLDRRIQAKKMEIDDNERRLREIEEENRRLEQELLKQQQAATLAPKKIAQPVQEMRRAAPPQALRPPEPAAPEPQSRREQSPTQNVLPPKIQLLPGQVEHLEAYDYNDTNPLALSAASNRITEEEFRRLRAPSFEPNRSQVRSNEPPREEYSTPMREKLQQPQAQHVYMQSPVTPPQPAPAVVYRTQPQTTYHTTISQPVTTTVWPPQPVSVQQPIQYYQQQPPVYQTTTQYAPTRTLQLNHKPTATYRINGVEYTEATLPAEFRHLLK